MRCDWMVAIWQMEHTASRDITSAGDDSINATRPIFENEDDESRWEMSSRMSNKYFSFNSEVSRLFMLVIGCAAYVLSLWFHCVRVWCEDDGGEKPEHWPPILWHITFRLRRITFAAMTISSRIHTHSIISTLSVLPSSFVHPSIHPCPALPRLVQCNIFK